MLFFKKLIITFYIIIYSLALMLSLSSCKFSTSSCSDYSSQTEKKQNDKNQIDQTKQSTNKQDFEQSKQDKKHLEEFVNDSIQIAEINVDVKQKSDSIHIKTPCKGHYIAIVERININVNNTVTVRAKIENYPRGVLIMSTYENHTEGVIKIPEKNLRYHIKTDPDSGITYLMEYVESDIIIDSVLIPPKKP